MHFLKLAILVALVLLAEAKDETKNRDKRQQISFHPRRGGRPPPYAVQMEPIVQYSQRDPLYNPLVISKSDDGLYDDVPQSYYPSEPEPIIEIIIKESNESLPTPAPPPQTPRATKEPIQVFYVKYEKKKGHGDKSQLVYDAPIPALTPVEEHEKIEDPEPYPEEPVQVTPPTTAPSTTIRAIIRPDSELYHAPGNTGLKVTFGTDQVPPNNHHKRSDLEAPLHRNVPTPLPPPGSSKKPHGPFQPLHPIPRVTPAFPQQRIVNSFPPQQLLQQNQHLIPSQPIPPNPLSPNQQLPPNFPAQQFQIPVRNPQRPQRLPITIQGLPDPEQRQPFNSIPPHRVNLNQQGFSNQQQLLSLGNFNPEHQQNYKQQQEEQKQKYFEQRRHQELLKQREQQRLAEQQRLLEQQKIAEHQRQEQLRQEQQKIEQQKYLDQQRLQENQRLQEHQRLQEQRRKQEQEQKFLQEQQYRQQVKYQQVQQNQHNTQVQHNPQIQHNPQVQHNTQVQHNPIQQPQKPLGEIFKAVPKLEQHYAIRENPLHPGPFPPNPQQVTQFQESQSQYLVQKPTIIGDSRNQQVQQQNQHQQQQNQFQERQNEYLAQKPNIIGNSRNQQVQQQNQNQQKQQQTQFQESQNQYLAQKPNIIGDSRNQQAQQQNQHQQQKNQQQLQNYKTLQQNQQFFSQNLQTAQQQKVQSSPTPSIWGRPVFQQNSNQKIFATPETKTEEEYYPSSTTASTTTSTTEPSSTISPKNEAKIKENIANLPDEVPDDIREQLLSSGILSNADIQILDYDKVGDIPIENLPPEALENFYGAGGAAATSASEPVPALAKRPKTAEEPLPKKVTPTEIEQATLKPGGVEMKVVRFDPNTAQGQDIADQHIREDATHLNPVTVGAKDDPQYNRYLPLKVSGASFPIPDVPELNGKKISSVVVLAPVDYNFKDDDGDDDSRRGRKLSDVQAIKFLAGESLKQLVKKPTMENYRKWLEQERQTEPQRQSVVLLVTAPQDRIQGEKEIFMYDVSTQTVSRLSGDLSSAFVDAAESNSDSPDPIDESTIY